MPPGPSDWDRLRGLERQLWNTQSGILRVNANRQQAIDYYSNAYNHSFASRENINDARAGLLCNSKLAGIGVIASLIFVGLEIRHNARAVRSGTAQRVHENYADWYLALCSSPSALAISVKGLADLGSLSSDEKPAFICVFTGETNHGAALVPLQQRAGRGQSGMPEA